MQHFRFYNREDLLFLTRLRRFETKLGERLTTISNSDEWEESLRHSPAKYILIGIPEDIGVKGNFGNGGADSVWLPFLSAFLNIQSNDYFSGEEMMVLGHFDFGDLKYLIENNASNEEERVDAYRHAVHAIDEEVESLVKVIAAANKIPVVIGGGHNNAYPLIKGVAKGLTKAGVIPLAQINAVNLDAHTDYRPLEGRHSGNGFRYADEDGFLHQYCVVGIHENYVPQNVLTDMAENPFTDYITWEDIFLYERRSFMQAVAHAADFTKDGYTGIELDLDAIQGVLSSAETPVGISAINARQYVYFTASENNVAYLHICEGAQQLSDGRRCDTTGKLISYLVTDFVKAHVVAVNDPAP